MEKDVFVSMMLCGLVFVNGSAFAQDKREENRDLAQSPRFVCALKQGTLTFSVRQVVDFATGDIKTMTNAALKLEILVTSPSSSFEQLAIASKTSSHNTYVSPGKIEKQVRKGPVMVLDKLRYGGNDVKIRGNNSYWSVLKYYKKERPEGAIGSFTTQIHGLYPFLEQLDVVVGRIFIPLLKEKKEMELKPLTDYLDRKIDLSNGCEATIRIKNGTTVDYSILSRKGYSAEIKLYTADGEPLRSHNAHSSIGRTVSNGQWHYKTIPDGVFAVITYTAGINVQEASFRFTEVPIPGPEF